MDDPDRRALVAGSLGAMGAALAGCSPRAPVVSASDRRATSASSTTTATARPAPVAAVAPPVDRRPRWPLTGRLLPGAQSGRHAAIAVKVPDNEYEHPQVGIDLADIVFVELDGYRDSSGYSSTRLVPVFHSRMPEDVAPVRSIRPVDIPLLSPMDAVIGNTGGAGWVLGYATANSAHLESMLSFVNTEGSGSYSINRARVRSIGGVRYYDQAVVCHPKVLARQTRRFATGPAHPYFPFATGPARPSTVGGGAPARTIRVPWKAGQTYAMSYEYDPASRRYLRSMPWGPHVLAGGRRVSTDNVLVIRARQRYAKIYRGGGHVEPIHDIVKARGTFFYANQGRVVTGAWTKGEVDGPFSFTLAGGTPLVMAPGQTFVELARTDAVIRVGR